MDVTESHSGGGWGVRAATAWVFVAAVLAGCNPDGLPCPENPCGPGRVCEDGTCVAQGDCPGGCPESQICSDGECIFGEGQCEEVGASCDPNAPTKGGFLCVPWTGDPDEATCAEVCGGGSSCASGSACVLLGSVGERSCSGEAECGSEQTCDDGSCRFAACRPSECSGFFVGDGDCRERYGESSRRFPNGPKCYPLQNGANFCLPAGTRSRGESCTSIRTAVQNGRYGETCAQGLACEDGVCVRACEGESDCSGGESCIGVEESTVREGIGRCADGCDPFTDGACGEGETCKPVGDGVGECIESGERPAYSECSPGAGQCEEGTVCVVYEEGGIETGGEPVARCHPLCDLSAGEREEDGSLGDEAQARRDATCPQPEPAPASVRFVHTAAGAGPVDLYRSGRSDPLATGLASGAASSGEGGEPYFSLEAGSYDFSVLPEGAPRTDFPLGERTERLGPGEARLLVVAAPGGRSESELQLVSVPPADPASPGEGTVGLRVVHAVSDAAALDVVAVPQGADLAQEGRRRDLASGLAFAEAGEPAGLEVGTYDVYAFPTGANTEEAVNADIVHQGVRIETRSTLFLHGTLDPGDVYPTDPAAVLATVPPPSGEPERPPTRCIESDDGSFGYCQQRCTRGAADYGSGICRGAAMGCVPVRRSDRQRTEHLCAPVGGGEVGDPCRPSAQFAQCEEGNYCLEYGNTRSGYSSGDPRGLCTSLCSTEGDPSEILGCRDRELCQPLGGRRELGVGECGIPCSPDDGYSDAEACPRGLRSCTPSASLEGSLSGRGDPPRVRPEQSFCSVSGDLEPGEPCAAQNCRPSAECLFSRSRQTSLVETILSPYIGTSGQSPRCRPRCDPFDGDDSAIACGDGETCLMNFPWSAEVGHCAEIESDRDPGSPCDAPGLACGEDSICVDRGDEAICTRFCDYEGPTAAGGLGRSTCPSGFTCEPFTRDIGVCRR